MKSAEKLESVLSEVINCLRGARGVVCVILFGSYARGDYDQYSDIDLLVIFQDEDEMWKNRRQIFEKISKTGLLIQMLTRTVDELNRSDPHFLKTVLQEGRILLMRYPLDLEADLLLSEKYLLINYSLKGVSESKKQSLLYTLYGKDTKSYSYGGLLEKSGGRKVARACILVPKKNSQKIIQVLKKYAIPFKAEEIWMKIPLQKSRLLSVNNA